MIMQKSLNPSRVDNFILYDPSTNKRRGIQADVKLKLWDTALKDIDKAIAHHNYNPPSALA